MLLQEGAVRFAQGNAFYRRSSQRSRDLAVLATIWLQQQQLFQSIQADSRPIVLDGMSACGVRALRYIQEAGAKFVWANDANPDIHGVLSQNLATVEANRYCITHQSAQMVLHQAIVERRYFDVIDLDAFGNPAAFVAASMQALRFGGLLYITSTDGRSLSGQLPHQSMQQWGSYVRSHPAVHEQALRVLLGMLHHQAMLLGYGIQPIFSLYGDKVFRVMVQLQAKLPSVQPKQPIAHYGFLGYCHHCGQYRPVDWRSLGRGSCRCGQIPTVSGPMWLGDLHDAEWLAAMQTLAEQRAWTPVVDLLGQMRSEVGLPPYFYTLGEVGRRGKMDIPKRDRLEDRLRSAGYRFSQTHIHPEGFKTDAAFADCLAVARQ